MALGAGTRLGRYEILEAIGSGGMGAVYRARDTSLGREVAIKVLLDEFTADTDRVRRFEREAKATAALNHPNLLAVYDIGTHDGLTFIVSELLEGRTLREVIAAGPVSPKRAARYAAQVADGLAAAHAKGIVHRDLKPANLFVTRDDRVKILDFGLARVVAASPADQGLSLSTETSLTAAGTVLGSAGYMSPEQVRGAGIDHRSDIFSLGAVLYEMLTGRRAFHRDSIAGTLAAIVESDPPTWSSDGSVASQRVMRLSKRCLEKNPEQRFQSAGDLAHLLADEGTDESGAVARETTSQPPWKRIAVVAAVIAVVMTAFGVWAWLHRSPGVSDATPIAFDLPLPVNVRVSGAPVLSSDGSQVAFVGVRDRVSSIYLRKFSDPDARPLSGTEGARQPFFSPRGDRLAFFAAGSLKIIALDGGVPYVLCPAPDPRGGAWGDDDGIVFAAGPTGALTRMPAGGGTPEPITTLGPGEDNHRWPLVIPGAKGVIFVATTKDGSQAVMSIGGTGQAPVRLIPHATAPRYAKGWLFYVNDDEELLAAPFDAASFRTTAPGVPQPERFAVGSNISDFAYGVSPNGTLAFVPFAAAERKLVVVGRGLQPQTIPGPPRPFEAPRASPDGQRIAVTVRSRTHWGDVWIGDLSGPFLPLTRDGRSRVPVWSPRGDQVAVESLRASSISSVFFQPTNGSEARRLVTDSNVGHVYPVAWLQNGGMMIGAYNSPSKLGLEELVLVPSSGRPASRVPLAISQAAYGRVSPDEKWLAYTTSESGQWEVYLTAFPSAGQVWAVSKTNSGREPVWSKSGNDLFFLQADGTVMEVGIGANGPTAEPRLAGVGKFPLSLRGAGDPYWDTLPGGRFVVTQSISEPAPRPIAVVLNRAANLSAK